MTFEERAEYLHQLKEKAGLDPENPKDMLLAEMADAMAILCHQMYSIMEVNDGLNESVAVLEEQMRILFEDDEPAEGYDEEDYFSDGDDPLYQVKCPDCGDQFAVDGASLEQGFACPNCGAHLVKG